MKNNIKKINKLTINKELAMFIIGAVITVLVLIGSSYAIFTMVITSNKEHTVTSGILSIKFEENSEVISLNNTYPMTDEEGLNTKSYNIKITNTGTLDAKYRISLKDDSSIKNIVPKNLLKLSYKEDPNNYINPILISSLENEAIIVKDKILAVKNSINYEFKIWLDISAGNEVQGKTYKSKIVVESVPLTDDYSDTISPIIKLNGELNNNILKGEVFTDLGIESVIDNKDTLNKDNVVKTYEYFNGTTTTIVDNINTNNLGIYFIYYKIKDLSLNEGIVVRTVNINNTTPPTINLIGNSTIELLEGSAYTKQGVTAINNKGENISSKVLILGTVNHLKAGTYIIKYISIDNDNNMSSVIRTVNVIKTTYIFDYTGASQMFTVPRNGTYKIELWGANGGFYGLEVTSIAGRGGYTKGEIFLDKNQPLYLYIGEKGDLGKHGINVGAIFGKGAQATFNGGGAGGQAGGGLYPFENYVGGPSGGGATDIRLTNGVWNDFESLKSRVMVAGAGGGSSNLGFVLHNGNGNAFDSKFNGGNNIGIVGMAGTTIGKYYDVDYTNNAGVGGTQLSGYGFGKGGKGDNSGISDYCHGHSGGGGGYYGGMGAIQTAINCFIIGGGGGSSFISGYTGCNAIASNSTSTNIIHTNQPNHYSNKVFTNSLMIAGNTTMPNPRGNGNIIGNIGNGYAKITLINLN